MFFEFDDYELLKAKIKVVGVGGAGGNALNRMIKDALVGVDFVAVNTDAQDLEENLAEIKIQIGKETTKGLGSGADAELGRQAVDENQEMIELALKGADMVFITGGMGGGTGTGAAPYIAKIAKKLGCLTIGIVTRPFMFEGRQRADRAEKGIQELRRHCDTTLVIPNETLMRITDPNTTFTDALIFADSILHQATRGISDLINIHGLINLDFADVRTVMRDMGDAVLGTGIGHGEERAILAAQQAISSPLLQDCNIAGAKGLLVNVTGDSSMTLHEVNDAASIVNEEAGQNANVIFGAVIDPDLSDEFRVTVIATGFNTSAREAGEDDSLDARAEALATSLSNSQQDVEVPAFQRDMNYEEEPNDQPEQSAPELPVFGNDLDVPAILRARLS